MPKLPNADGVLPVVLITGDVVVDHHLYIPERSGSSGSGLDGATLNHVELGGAAIIERLLTSADNEKAALPFRAKLGLVKDETLYPHCYATLTPIRLGGAASWRVRDELGYGLPCPAYFPSPRNPGRRSAKGTRGMSPALGSVVEPSIPPNPEFVVIDDSGTRFREASALWPACLTSEQGSPDRVLWKMSGDLGGGSLWRLMQTRAGMLRRLIVLVSAADLRRAGHRVARGLSWERSALDTRRVLKSITRGPLAEARHVIVSFQGAGAMWMERSPNAVRSTLVFDPRESEADLHELARGKVYGFQACFSAGIAWALAAAVNEQSVPEREVILDGVRRGLNARRELQRNGHGPADAALSPSGFPAQHIRRRALFDPAQSFASVELPDRADHAKWTILSESSRSSGGSGPLYAEARLVALNGLSALHGMPSLEVGGFATVDRHEIESLRRIHALISQYENETPQSQPLSLAVFGAPGAGKNFIVEQIAKWVLGDRAPFLQVNLSQFYDEKELIGAFHRVRDLVLGGVTPVVLWDEFDAQEYRWLRLLLAPMQDGNFQEGQIVHLIGKCVFVFAGGTSSSYESFSSRANRRDAEGGRDARVWRFAKGPDFVSRLQGSLDVLGPNQRLIEKPGAKPRLDPADVCFPIRRALFLRGSLGVPGSTRLQIEPALLDALLRVPRYTHGSRSFKRILARLRTGGTPFRKGELPSFEDLAPDIAGECAHPHDGRRNEA